VKTRLVPSKNALLSGPGLTSLLLAAWCLPSLAATGVDVECPETKANIALASTELAVPELTNPALELDAADPTGDDSAAIEDEIVARPLASPAVSASEQDDERATDVETSDASGNETTPTATRLPGVSATDQPRFRRQMYRTDI